MNTVLTPQPSAWRIGMLGWRANIAFYLVLIVGQFAINATVSAIYYATSEDFSGHVDQAPVNAAFMTGIYLFIAQIVSTTIEMRAASLSGASRRTLAVSTYVYPGFIIVLASAIWWVLALVQPHIFFLGQSTYPLGIDSWLIVVAAWIACDGAGRLIGVVSRHANGPWEYTLGFILAIPLGLAAIAAPVTWLVLTLVHKSGYLPPMHLGFWFLGLVTLAVLVAGWRLTSTGRLRRLG